MCVCVWITESLGKRACVHCVIAGTCVIRLRSGACPIIVDIRTWSGGGVHWDSCILGTPRRLAEGSADSLRAPRRGARFRQAGVGRPLGPIFVDRAIGLCSSGSRLAQGRVQPLPSFADVFLAHVWGRQWFCLR